MIDKLKINTFELLMCFSDALDLISPLVAGHQIRVAYIALRLAKQYKLTEEQIYKIVVAACIHDIGATIKGQLLARNGAVTLDTNIIAIATCSDTTTVTTADTTTVTTPDKNVVKSTVVGGQLPKTGTNIYPIIIGGFVLIIAGTVVWINRKQYE